MALSEFSSNKKQKQRAKVFIIFVLNDGESQTLYTRHANHSCLITLNETISSGASSFS